MPHAKTPEQPAGDDKQHSDERQQHICPVGYSADQIKERIILKKGKGDDIGQKFQHLIAIDGKGIHAEFLSAVGKDIHEFEAFRCKEAQGGIYDKQAGKDHGA